MSLRSWLREPLFWILAAAGLLRLAGLSWGMPASDGWDDDGFAPRNFLTALALTYKSGVYFTYPPLHAFLLAVLTWPAIVMALLHSHSFAQADVVREFIKIPYMTFFAIMGRLVGAAMSLGIIVCVGQMAALIGGRRAGILGAAACALGTVFTYYSQVTNLDVPYLFWSLLALLWFMRAIAWHEPARFRHAALFAAAALATKDQAYAIFALSLPAILLLWFWVDPWPRAHARPVMVTLLVSGLAALALLLLVDGAITNPGGFARRIAFLAGPASRDFATYQATLGGRLDLLKDIWAYFALGPALLASALAALGFCLHTFRARGDKARWIAGFLPLLATLSFTIAFNLTALRTDDRFLLPQAILAAVYIGVAADSLIFSAHPWLDRMARPLLAIAAVYAFYQCTCVDAAMIFDPRYDAEHWLDAHIRRGDTIETYGRNAYLPRFPQGASVFRVAQSPLNIRNPLPQVREIDEPFAAGRDPHFIVVSAWWVRQYQSPQSELGGHRLPSKTQQALFNDEQARRYFARLYGGESNYSLVHRSTYGASLWPPVHIHESLDEGIDIFERKGPVSAMRNL